MCVCVWGVLASYLSRVGGEKQPGIDCLCMRAYSLGICVHLEIEKSICISFKDVAIFRLNYLQLHTSIIDVYTKAKMFLVATN